MTNYPVMLQDSMECHTLLKTKIAPKNRPGPKRKGLSSNHPFSFRCKLAVSFREGKFTFLFVVQLSPVLGCFVGRL